MIRFVLAVAFFFIVCVNSLQNRIIHNNLSIKRQLSTIVVRATNADESASNTHDNSIYSDSHLVDKLFSTSERCEKFKFIEIFGSMTNDKSFVENMWQQRPFLCDKPLPNIYKSYIATDLKTDVDKDFIEAGRGTFEDGKTGWNMKAVSKPRGKSFDDAKLRFEDIEVALKEKSGTVVINSAGGFIPRMASVCLDAMGAFQLPVALNMYVTSPGQRTSAPPHTDKQDVFVMQCQGKKRWRVFSPPPTSRMPRADPLARGKSSDILTLFELEKPLIDDVLQPGQVLYVPAGFPHTTDTITEDAANAEEPSLHLTLGVDTHIWSLNFASARSIILKRAGLPDKLLLTKLTPELYWSLQSALPFGFLDASLGLPINEDPLAMPSPEQIEKIAQSMLSKMRAAEPNRWSSSSGGNDIDISDHDLIDSLDIKAVITRLAEHRITLVEVFHALYSDVAFKITPVKMDLSFFRSQVHYLTL